MLMSALAALALFAAPDAAQSGGAAPEAKAEPKPSKTCYTVSDPGSRLPRKVCVTRPAETEEQPAAEAQPATEDKPAADAKTDAPKPE